MLISTWFDERDDLARENKEGDLVWPVQANRASNVDCIQYIIKNSVKKGSE